MQNFYIAVILLSILVVSCAKPKVKMDLTYSVNVPEKYIEKISDLKGKGNVYKNVDLEVHYRTQHREGWEECLSMFLDGRLQEDSKVSLKQYWSVHEEADKAGFNLCKSSIFKMLEHYSEKDLKEYIRTKSP